LKEIELNPWMLIKNVQSRRHLMPRGFPEAALYSASPHFVDQAEET
jgi:hypothetical protein